MINVQTLYQRVEDLARKNKSGYVSNDEFNRNLNEAQLLLMNFYHHQFQKTNHLADALEPFVKNAVLPLVGQNLTKPTDYRHLISISVEYVKSICNEEPEITIIPSQFVRAAEKDKYLGGHVLKPSLENEVVIHTFENGKIKIWPRVPEVSVTYLRTPADGNRVVNIDPNTDLETYSSTSTHLEWPAFEQSNFVDLLLLFVGVSVKETALIQFSQKNQTIQPI